MLKGILFDLDGVLVDSEDIYFRSIRDSFRKYGFEVSRQEYVRRWMIEQTKSKGLIEDHRLIISLDEITQLKDKFFHQYMIDMQMMPGALEMLQRFYGKYPLGIVSSGNKKDIQLRLCKFDLNKFFNIIVSCEDVQNKKPHPEPYQKGCELLRINPEYVLVIEDNPSGVKSAKEAGCKVIARPDGFTANMDFSLADKVIKNFDEINEDLINELFK